MNFINYAHRGASEHYPENTLLAFYMGLEAGANGIETDIMRTKDGTLVLFHDNDTQRTLGAPGAIRDYTYEELRRMDFGAFKGERFRGEKVATLEEFLFHFSAKPLQFALELKEEGVEADTLRLIEKYGALEKTTITSFRWESLVQTRAQNARIRLGYLTKTFNEETLAAMRRVPITQICPHVDNCPPELVKTARSMGFSIRLWGVSNEEKMRKALLIDSDGMTVNDPVALNQALQSRAAAL